MRQHWTNRRPRRVVYAKTFATAIINIISITRRCIDKLPNSQATRVQTTQPQHTLLLWGAPCKRIILANTYSIEEWYQLRQLFKTHFTMQINMPLILFVSHLPFSFVSSEMTLQIHLSYVRSLPFVEAYWKLAGVIDRQLPAGDCRHATVFLGVEHVECPFSREDILAFWQVRGFSIFDTVEWKDEIVLGVTIFASVLPSVPSCRWLCFVRSEEWNE